MAKSNGLFLTPIFFNPLGVYDNLLNKLSCLGFLSKKNRKLNITLKGSIKNKKISFTLSPTTSQTNFTLLPLLAPLYSVP